ncbi:MAG: hypothetical protein ACRDGF_03245 [Chloroflexota bacterium]
MRTLLGILSFAEDTEQPIGVREQAAAPPLEDRARTVIGTLAGGRELGVRRALFNMPNVRKFDALKLVGGDVLPKVKKP